MTDRGRIALLRRDPDAGMERILKEYAGLIYAVVRGKLSVPPFCEADIEGCVADTFSEFYGDLEDYDPDRGSIKAWLCVIARHNATDRLRRYQREQGNLSLEDGEAQYAEDYSLEADLEEAETRRALFAAVCALGEPDREILTRKFYLGEPSESIARRLGLTVTAVDTRTHRAIQKLREKFGGTT